MQPSGPHTAAPEARLRQPVRFGAALVLAFGALLVLDSGLPAGAQALLALALALALAALALALRSAQARLRQLERRCADQEKFCLAANRALEAELRQAQVSVDNVLDMILWVDAEDRRIAYANRAACQALGYAPEELLDQTIDTISRARTPETWRETCALLRLQGSGVYEVSYHRRDGSAFLVEARSSIVRHLGRDYVVAIVRDITQRKAAERALLAAKEEAESSSRAKSDFLANMTHEVRTPLNGILGMLQVLQLSGLTPEQQEYASVARQSAERLNLLLNNVIDYARLDPATDEAECLAFPPSDLLQALRAVFEPQAKAKGLAFTVQAAPNLPDLVQADLHALRQVLTQLLDNAFKFTATGHVLLAAAPAPDAPKHLVFRVEDSGIGIPPEKRQQVFEAFVQEDASFTRSFGGAGLGLAIVRKLTTRMGGTVAAQQGPNGGTVMLLTIPADCTAVKSS